MQKSKVQVGFLTNSDCRQVSSEPSKVLNEALSMNKVGETVDQ
jgi:hypothetical protein